MENKPGGPEKRTDERRTGDAIPSEFRRATITFDDGESFPVRVVNMNNCGFLFESDDPKLPSVIDLQEGEKITARFMGSETNINGICVHSSSRGRLTSLGCFISDPYEQNLVRDLLGRGGK